MSYRINENCISCGDCSIVCLAQAIDDGYVYNAARDINSTIDVVMDGARTDKLNSIWQGYRITAACNNCGVCVDVCPIGAIIKD